MTSFDHPLGEARFDAYVPADVAPALDAAEAEALQRLAAVANADDPLHAFGEAATRFDFVVAVATELGDVLGGDWRATGAAATSRAAAFHTTTYQRSDLYDAIAGAVTRDDVAARLRSDLLRRFERAGAGLDEAARDRVTAVNARLAELQSAFVDNIDAVDRESGAATDDPSGLPDDLVVVARAAAEQRGTHGYYVPYTEKNAVIVLREAHNRELREAMYRLTVSRAARANGAVLAEILELRAELAHLLGYPDYVELFRADRMVADPQALLDELAAAYRPQAMREHAELLAFAREFAGDPDLELTAADVDVAHEGYYAARMREARGLGATSSIRIPVDTAQTVMLDALGELYSVRFTRADVPVWHPDVEPVDLHDAAGRHLARIYCDWYARDGKRPFGGWMSPTYVATDGGPHLATVVTNIARTGADHGDLRIMWHEFGHALHLAFTRTRYRLRSPDDAPRDFIEGPSRIMEYWTVTPEILRRLGLPDSVADAGVADEQFRAASRKLARLARPALDLALHRGEDVTDFKRRFLPVPPDPADATAAHFHHVFGRAQYAGGHYAYQWAGVLAADLFTRFADAGVLDPGTGRDYAEQVLGPGAERDPVQSVREFLGREVTVDALLERDGIA